MSNPDSSRDPIMQNFDVAHLSESRQAVAAPYIRLAEEIHATYPRSEERTVTLRKVLEAMDSGVRAAFVK